jgi:hypothetical protein
MYEFLRCLPKDLHKAGFNGYTQRAEVPRSDTFFFPPFRNTFLHFESNRKSKPKPIQTMTLAATCRHMANGGSTRHPAASL